MTRKSLNNLAEIKRLLALMRYAIEEIISFDISLWDALADTPLTKQGKVYKYLLKVELHEFAQMVAVHNLPCYDKESMDNMEIMYLKPIHAEHKTLRRAHKRFKNRWKKLEERLNGSEENPTETKPGDGDTVSVD